AGARTGLPGCNVRRSCLSRDGKEEPVESFGRVLIGIGSRGVGKLVSWSRTRTTSSAGSPTCIIVCACAIFIFPTNQFESGKECAAGSAGDQIVVVGLQIIVHR